jgi:hypothetical protein
VTKEELVNQRNSRSQRWVEACELATSTRKQMEQALQQLVDIQQEYQDWRDVLPENLESSATAEKLDAKLDKVLDLDLQSALDSCVDLDDVLTTAADMDLPRGFGKD